MKILKKGKPWSIIVKCTGDGNGGGGCDAKLKVYKEDLFFTYKGYCDGSTDIFITIKCIDCSIKTDISESHIPISIRDEIKDKSNE